MRRVELEWNAFGACRRSHEGEGTSLGACLKLPWNSVPALLSRTSQIGRGDKRVMSAKQDADSATKTAGTEIERKFLVRELPDLDDVKKQEILQGYISVDGDGTEVRLRRI